MDTLEAVRERLAAVGSCQATVAVEDARELVIAPFSDGLDAKATSVRVRVSTPDLLDVWLERGSGWYIGPFEVDAVNELEVLATLVQHVMSGSAQIRRSPFSRQGRGQVSWPGGSWTAA